MMNTRKWLLFALSVFFLFILFAPFISETLKQPQRKESRKRMLNAKFQSIRPQGGHVNLVPRDILFVYLRPDVKVLRLATGSTFTLKDGRHWTHEYEVARIENDGIILKFRDSGRGFFPDDSIKLTWK